jgi:hypothetical protein
MLLISTVALYQAVEMYMINNSLDFSNILLSISGFVLSMYMFMTMRKKPLKLGFEIPKVTTIIKCSNCSFKKIRDFEKGDYILKEVGKCSECNNSPSMVITSIYREVDEK